MWVIAGLGNPGQKYSRTRHNIGFMVLEEVARRHSIDLKVRKGYRIGKGSIDTYPLLLVEPLLYMNLSGSIIKKVLHRFSIAPEHLITIYDDLDIQIGKLKIKKKGSSGGHKGIESIIQHISSQEFIRLKVGIGRQEGIPAEDYVLSKFKKNEIPIIKEMIYTAADAVDIIVTDGVERAMNTFN
jgi:PTH1 family peptidyl-tRNA hydrolase